MLSSRFIRVALLLGSAAAVTTGCPECAPDRVAIGVAQLSVRNVGAMVSVVNADTSCGFASDGVLGAASATGEVGSQGSLTFTVTDCVIDLGTTAVNVGDADCNGGQTTASGKLTISATRVINGLLTGDGTNPIVPANADAVTITIDRATFENFEVKSSTSDSFLTMIEGSLGATVAPRLAVDEDQKACSVATPNVTFTDIAYGPSKLHVTTADNSFDVGVATSNLSAQNGKGPGGDENIIAGDITVFDSAQTLAEQPLDPEFDAATFASGYICDGSGLFLDGGAESYTCPNLNPLLADGAARLTIKMLGTVAGLVDADTTCGFSSPDAAVAVNGAVGDEGSVTLTISDCVIAFTAEETLDADCGGVSTTVSGTVTVSGTKTLSGLLTGSAESPVVPTTDQPAAIALTIVTDDFVVGSSADVNQLLARSGTLAGTVRPKVFVGADTGVCSVSSPNAGFDDVSWTDGDLLLTSSSGSFSLAVDSASLEAANGTSASGTNELTGTFTIDGEAFTVPSDGGGLNPDYDQAALDASFICDPALAEPPSDACAEAIDVSLKPRLADGAARLTVKMLGTVAGIIDADTTCGFGSAAVLGAADITGTPGGEGTLTLTVTDCEIAFDALTTLTADCNGDATEVEGTITVSGTKTVNGRFTGNPASPIVPITDQPAAIALTIVTTDFTVSSTADDNALLASSGTLEGTVSPKVFIGADTGVCSVSSPNAGFDDVAWTNADLAITSSSGTFLLAVDSATLEAANGTSSSGTNELTGSFTIDGASFPVPSDGAGLNPDFDQTALDASFTCNPALADPISDLCVETLNGTIAGGIAALTARTFGTVVSLIDANSTCGFSSIPVAVVGATFVGAVGDPGSTATFTISSGCTIALPAAGFVVSTDCLGGTTTVAGSVTVTGTKTVTGWRTGDVAEPIIPDNSTPATFDLTLAFDGAAPFTVTSSTSTAALTVRGGTLEGVVEPRVALDPTTGACSIGTPNVTFSDLAWTAAPVTLVSDGNAFTETITTSALDAQNGNAGDGSAANTIAGVITIGGNDTTLAGPLDPAFNQTAFDSTYQCAGNGSPILVPNAACSFRQALGIGAAALLVKAAATAVSVHDKNTICGFASDTSPTAAPTATPPAPGTLTFDSAAGCQSGFVSDTTIATDCVGDETHASGGFATTAASTKVVNGLFTGVANPSFVPTARDSALLTLPGIQFAGWTVAATDTADVVESRVSITSGTASLVVNPITGKNAAASAGVGVNVFTESTGIASIENLVADNVVMTILSSGKTFNLTLTDVDLDAFAGAFFDGTTLVGSNDLAGTVTVDGELVSIAPATPLNPAYDQAAFDATYTCNPALGDPPDVVPSAAP